MATCSFARPPSPLPFLLISFAAHVFPMHSFVPTLPFAGSEGQHSSDISQRTIKCRTQVNTIAVGLFLFAFVFFFCFQNTCEQHAILLDVHGPPEIESPQATTQRQFVSK